MTEPHEFITQMTLLAPTSPNAVTIPLHVARPFIERWHYSHMVPTGKNIFFGWWLPDATLYAVANYGIGVNPYSAEFLASTMKENVRNSNLIELKRLCRREPAQTELPLTKFLSQCHRLLRRRGVRFVVSYSDPAYGHNGGIYRAASFVHAGRTHSEWHLADNDGTVRHRRMAGRHAERHGISIAASRDILNLHRTQTPPKDRWFKKL